MNDNLVILIVVLVAANLILIAVAVIRSILRKDRYAAGAPYEEGVMRRPLANGVSSPIAPMPGNPPTMSRIDPLTGLLILKEWNRIVADEDARVNRYRHPATVVIIELDGFERLVENLGPDAGDRVLPALADALSRNARAADHLARIGTSRFGILLPETGEIEAINFIERVREACDMWLESGSVALHLSIGWASPPPESSLADAVARAHERMFTEQRRNARLANDVGTDGPPSFHDVEGSPSPA